MADAKPAPWERRYLCYQLAVTFLAAERGDINADVGLEDVDWWANNLHQRLFGGPLPPVDAAGQPQSYEAAPEWRKAVAPYKAFSFSCGCFDTHNSDGTTTHTRCPAHMGIANMAHPERP